MDYQHTIKDIIKFSGIGLHTGKIVNIKILPAEANSGITFIRADLDSNNIIKADFRNVTKTTLSTLISNGFAEVGTIEHLMSALWASNVDNAIIEIDSDEPPILDGSSSSFCTLLLDVGVRRQNILRQYINLKTTKSIVTEKFSIIAEPAEHFMVEYFIKFDHKLIDEQKYIFNGSKMSYISDIAHARTFGFLKDVEMLKANGLAMGGSLENAIILDDERILNAKGLRYEDEFVRHKILDAIGDFYLAGHINAKFTCICSGHYAHNKILHEIFNDESCFISVTKSHIVEAEKSYISA